MFREHASLRNFKGGSWDLRKDDRRKAQASIGFPDRRGIQRRGATRADDPNLDAEPLTWLSKSPLDE